MRNLPETFLARLRGETTTLCWCWRFGRTDGRTYGATDHDRALLFEGVEYRPAAGLEAVELVLTAGLAPGRASAAGALDLDFMIEADLLAGRWDRARVDVWRVDWEQPEHRVLAWSGRLSEVSRHGAAFHAELVSLKADLERMIGRVYAGACDAEVGDARCRADLSGPAMRAVGAAESLEGRVLHCEALAAFAAGWFAGGVLTWTNGAVEGLKARVTSHAGGRLDLEGPVGAAGDGFVVTAGCDHGFGMCGAKFGNRDNFRGFPHLPGPDAVLAGPSAGANGGRRA